MTLNVNKILLLFICTGILGAGSIAQAQSRGGSVKPSIGAMILFAQGQTGNDSDVLKRSMIHTPIAVFAGFNIRKYRIGLNYEYNLVGQSADPAEFSNQNIGGKGSSAGLRFDFYDGKNSFGLIYHLSQKFTLDKPTLAGTVSEYEGKSAFSIQYYRQVKNKIGIVVDYSMGEMKSSGGNSNDLKWDRAGIGLVFTNFPGRTR